MLTTIITMTLALEGEEYNGGHNVDDGDSHGDGQRTDDADDVDAQTPNMSATA